MEETRARPLLADDVLQVLVAEAERVLATLDVASLSISVWEREHGHLRTLVNAGVLGPGEKTRPQDEVYPVDSFPALVDLLVHRTPYCFGRGDPVDVASASLVALLRKETQASAPITLRGEVWGSLWVATLPGGRPLTAADIPSVVRAANRIARALDAAGPGVRRGRAPAASSARRAAPAAPSPPRAGSARRR